MHHSLKYISVLIEIYHYINFTKNIIDKSFLLCGLIFHGNSFRNFSAQLLCLGRR